MNISMSEFSEILKIVLQIANVVIIGYGLYRFLNKPHDTLADEVKEIKEMLIEQKTEIKEVKKSLDSSHEKHREQAKVNATFKSVMLSFVHFEIGYCLHTGYDHQEDLLQAKKELEEYLTGKE